MRNLRSIALLVDTSRETGRGVLRGVIRYNKEHGPWSIFFQPHGIDDSPPRWLMGWKGDGIIARINDRRMARLLQQTGLPVIDVRGAISPPEFPMVEIDNRILTDMVIAHFSGLGLKRVAFCAHRRGAVRLYDERCDAFVQRARLAGVPCSVYQSPSKRGHDLSWDEEQRQLGHWLKRLGSPIGILACNDDWGLKVLHACQRFGINVPDEAAVIGVENDPFLCNLSVPPLSSVDVNSERVGYEACVVLEKQMQGRHVPTKTPLSPSHIVERRSTDVLAIEDRDVVRAIRYLRDHACLGMAVSELSEQVPLSRSMLNRRFLEVLGRSPKEEITRVQMARARELLINTDLSIHAVAKSCGFVDANYFSKRFHDQHRISPRRFRARARK